MTKQKHTPVLLTEVLHYLRPQRGESYLDVTAGYGGHAQAILAKTDNPKGAVLIDRDEKSYSYLKEIFKEPSPEILHSDYLSASKHLESEHKGFDIILADLGVNSVQFDDPSRGFSYAQQGQLDMRMDQAQELKADDIVNQSSLDELVQIFRQYGEEPKALAIASDIVKQRPIKTTEQLAAIAARHWPRGRNHQATRIFQALRIVVNDELNQLEQSLQLWLDLLNPSGRLTLISFHSLEDRLVKQFFTDNSTRNLEGQLEILTKKPVVATNDEIVSNPRARSAKLRAAVKIKTKRKDYREPYDAY